MTPGLALAVESALGRRVEHAVRVRGGDINDAYRVRLDSGETVFVKAHAQVSSAMFVAEAKGLRWLAEAAALSVPEVLAVGGFGETNATDVGGFLVLRWLEQRTPVTRFDEYLGQRLALLHRSFGAGFGFDSDNFIGRLPQRNRSWPSFAEFYRHERLVPQFKLATDAGFFDSVTVRAFERLLARLEQLLGLEEPPSRLHGDLWNGNVLVGPDGEPWLIDPAVYGGDREVDLAMMRLFGGFSERVFESYAEVYPLRPSSEERVALFQLYPLLVHVNLFGGGYVERVRRILGQYR